MKNILFSFGLLACDGTFKDNNQEDTARPLIEDSAEGSRFVAKFGGCYRLEANSGYSETWHGHRFKLYEDGVYTQTLTKSIALEDEEISKRQMIEFCLQKTTSSFELQYFSGSFDTYLLRFELYDPTNAFLGEGKFLSDGFLYFDGAFYSNGDMLQAFSVPEYVCDSSLDGDCDGVLTAEDCDDSDASVGAAPVMIEQFADVDIDFDGIGDKTEIWIRDEWNRPYSYEYWDGSLIHAEIWIYDSEGRLVSYELDNDGNGSSNWGEYWNYDSNGNLLSYEKDRDGDGVIDSGGYATYDSNDNQISYEEYQGSSFTPSEIFTYDSDSNLLSVELSFEEVFTYDSNQKLLSWEVDYSSGSDEGKYFTHDSNGLIQSIDEDRDRDGQVDIIHTFAYDAAGQLSSKQGVDLAGNIRETESWSYFPNTNQLQQYDIDRTNANGSSSFNHYTYNEAGREIMEHWFDGGDDFYYYHDYDGNGNLLANGCYGNSICNFAYTYQYDENGNQIYEYYTTDDGMPHYTEYWEYNSNNQLLMHSWFPEQMIHTAYTEYYSYDSNGNLSFVERYDADDVHQLNKAISQQDTGECP